MSTSQSRRFPVTVTHLPVTRCQICHRTVAYRPGSLAEVLIEHYRRAHPPALGILPGCHPEAARGERVRRCSCEARNTGGAIWALRPAEKMRDSFSAASPDLLPTGRMFQNVPA